MKNLCQLHTGYRIEKNGLAGCPDMIWVEWFKQGRGPASDLPAKLEYEKTKARFDTEAEQEVALARAAV
nr:hypothetical protein Q903MT_gene6337 [Picea sitchensis]